MEKKVKRPYKRPEVSEVKLTPEEAVLSGCKTDSGTGAPKSATNLKCRGHRCAAAIGS